MVKNVSHLFLHKKKGGKVPMQSENKVLSHLFEEPSCFYRDRGSFCFKKGKLFKITELLRKTICKFLKK